MGQGEDLSHGPSCSLFREVTKDRLSRCSTAAKGNGNTDFSTASTRASESFFCLISLGSEAHAVALLGCPPSCLPSSFPAVIPEFGSFQLNLREGRRPQPIWKNSGGAGERLT